MIDYNKKLHFSDVCILPKRTTLESRKDVNLNVKYSTPDYPRGGEYNGVPVIVANMDVTGTIAMARALKPYGIYVALHKHYSLDILANLFYEKENFFSNVFLTFGINDIDKLYHLADRVGGPPCIDYINLDVANGYMTKFHEKVKQVRKDFPNTFIMAGNVCTAEGVELLSSAKISCIKIGISGGLQCRTKNKTAIGNPQFSCILECVEEAEKQDVLICSDGGVKQPADICKALGAGANFVMAGSLFAGYEENEGEWEYEAEIVKTNSTLPWGIVTGKQLKSKIKFYGMSSKIANDKYNGGLADYKASEGNETWILYKGSVVEIAKDIRGSLASCCTYTNTKNLQDLDRNCEFIIT